MITASLAASAAQTCRRPRSSTFCRITIRSAIAPSASGSLTLPTAATRAGLALLLLSPHVPMLFMGEEYARVAAVPLLLRLSGRSCGGDHARPTREFAAASTCLPMPMCAKRSQIRTRSDTFEPQSSALERARTKPHARCSRTSRLAAGPRAITSLHASTRARCRRAPSHCVQWRPGGKTLHLADAVAARCVAMQRERAATLSRRSVENERRLLEFAFAIRLEIHRIGNRRERRIAVRRSGRSAAALFSNDTSPTNIASAPRATYRVQLNREFTFNDAARIVPYLARLGISHLYTSPILKARPGSMHGYDVVDHTRAESRARDAGGFRSARRALHAHSMGLIVDIVPNHLGIMGCDNEWWLDVLENGPAARSARYFDIDWRPESRLAAQSRARADSRRAVRLGARARRAQGRVRPRRAALSRALLRTLLPDRSARVSADLRRAFADR